ncbi:unnamed protein product, partial [Discosporangium mesarthrocarpum]
DEDNLADEGETIEYMFTVENSGNVNMKDIQVADNKVTQGLYCREQPSVLTPLGSFECSGSYNLTQTDVDGGSVVNTAEVTGTDPSGRNHSASDKNVIDLSRHLELSLDKSGTYSVGVDNVDTISYMFKAALFLQCSVALQVSNLGTVTVTGISVVDPKLYSAIDCPANSLFPRSSMTCTSSEPYTVTGDELSLGSIFNTAS